MTKTPRPFSSRRAIPIALSIGIALAAAPAFADTTVIPALKDNTLIEHAEGSTSNGAGPFLFAGRISSDESPRRRAAIEFDVAAHVPRGAKIRNVVLVMHVDRLGGERALLRLHRALAEWGESSSRAEGGLGARAEEGDATWLHTSFDGAFWGTEGGDFVPAPSGAAAIEEEGGFVIFSTTSEMAADVQRWLDAPDANHGWIVLGDEVRLSTVVALDSRECEEATYRPRLIVHYTGGGGRRR